jgi:hypothetical protein
MVEPVYLLLVTAAWYFLLVAVDEGMLWPAALGGLLVGLAYLTRPEALVYLGFALGLLLVATWLSRRHSFGLRRAAANLGIAAAMFSLIAGPYLANLQLHQRRPGSRRVPMGCPASSSICLRTCRPTRATYATPGGDRPGHPRDDGARMKRLKSQSSRSRS